MPFMRDRSIDEAVIDHGETGGIVSAAPNGGIDILIDSESNSRPNVRRSAASRDGGRPAINHARSRFCETPHTPPNQA